MTEKEEWENRKEERYQDDDPVYRGWGSKKADWEPGPWAEEADRIEWRSDEGYPLLIVRGGHGALCGYVGVPPGHPWHGKHYGDIEPSPDCHGGLTFSDRCREGGKICHVARPGESDEIWWQGFDCAHCGDLCPAYTSDRYRDLGLNDGTLSRGFYQTVDHVRSEVVGLAKQAHAAVAANTFRGLAAELD